MCQSSGELGSNQSRRCAADIMWQSAAPSQRMLSYDSKNRAPVTTSGNSATRYAAGNDKSLFAILAILISILCMVCLLNVFIFIINHYKEFLLNNTLHSTIISTSISPMGVYFIEIFAIIYRSDRISNGYIVNELVIKLEILNEI